MIRSLLIEEWWLNKGSQRLSQMLKSPVITKRLQMLISVSLGYFIIEWEESEYTFITQKSLLLMKKETRIMSLWSIMSLRKEKWKEESLILMKIIIICCVWFFSKGEPIGMINNAHQWNTFTICWARNGSYFCPRQFLDEDNVEIVVDFEDCVYDEIIFSELFAKKTSGLSQSYRVGIHGWMDWILSSFPKFRVFLGVPLLVKAMLPERTVDYHRGILYTG